MTKNKSSPKLLARILHEADAGKKTFLQFCIGNGLPITPNTLSSVCNNGFAVGSLG